MPEYHVEVNLVPDAAEPTSVASRRMGMRRRRQPIAEGVRLALATGVLCLLVAACESSPGSTPDQDHPGRTVTAEPPTRPRPDASTTADASDIRLTDEADADLVLYVSNQSFEDSPVSIQIAIDGVHLVDQAFAIEGGHNWFTFPMSLPPGDHVLTATSGTGASIEQAVEIPGGEQRWAALDYWYSPEGEARRFTWHISTEPIVFA
ncbi:hypothetical protein [Ornithinimicrobium cryptoxanthini]|uniref:hypothetical protein n=1 Tax=Ornithinimicrobium cryptoxanthini TaxID=2934161 RepID=UPI0021185012|nr:hypothetical protein [Ornithinimicrobium cryptoxanthini]